jgi:phosphoadenylyl-sulfate reductase (thioredoxin)
VRAVIDHAAAGHALEGRTPAEVLRWAIQRVGRVAFATGFGAEGCVLIDIIGGHRLPIDVFTLDTGLLFPETYELWHRLEDRYGIVIRRVVPARTVAQQAAALGANLWERDPGRCCELRKVQPLRAALRGYDGWITAIRRDQTSERSSASVIEHDASNGITKINPLVGWTHDDVWAHVYAHDVPTNILHTQSYPSIGCQPCTSPILPGESLRAGRWRGAGRQECGLHAKKRP